MKPVHLATCVWGPWHVDVMSRIMWPCILADRNLPAFVRQCRAVYRICTTRRDQAKLRELPVFAAISRLVDVEFIDTPTEEPEPIFHMHRFFRALTEAREQNAIFFNLWPDVVFTDCTLGHAARTIADGRGGCALPTLRVVSETCIDDVVGRFSGPPGSHMTIPPGDVVRLGVQHLHPLSITSFADAVHGRPDTCILYRVPGEGLVLRSSYTWLYVDPRRITTTPSGEATTREPDIGKLVHIADGSDGMLFLSLAPLFKEAEVFRPCHHTEPIDVARLTLHPWLAVSPFYDHFDAVCTRLHYGPMTEAAWAPVVRRSEAAFRRVRMLRAFLRIWGLIKSQGCQQAARIMSAALANLKLPSGWLLGAPVTIFVPNDTAMATIAPERRRQLIDRRFARDIIQAMLAHVVAGSETLPPEGSTEHRSLTDAPIRISRQDGAYRVNESAQVVADLRSGPHRVCIIDQCLEPLRVAN